jgi:hypothetical protein
MRAGARNTRIDRLPRELPLIALALGLGFVLILDVVWLLRFRWGYPTEWDESGYLAIGVRDANALTHHGLVLFARTIENQRTEAPLVPAVASVVFAILGAGMGQGVLVICVFMLILSVATYAIGTMIMSRWWAVLAAITVAAAPVVTDYSRVFHFAVPAAALFTSAVWALMRSDRLDNRLLVVLCGLLLGLTVLARTMTIAYLPAIAVAAGLLVLGAHGRRRPLVVNAVLGALTGCVVAAVWYVRSWRSVVDYLRSSGYGADSSHFGQSRSAFALDFWTRIAGTVTNNLYLPLAAVIFVCLVLGATLLLRRPSGGGGGRGELLRVVTAPWFVLVVVVVEGYVALTSSKNDGTAFALPWLPALVILAIFAVSRASNVGVRTTAAVVFLLLIITGLAMKSGFVPPVADTTTVHVPGIGRATVVDGRGIVQASVVEASGFPAQSSTTPLPAFHKRWLTFEKRVVRAILVSGGRTPDLTGFIASDSQILSNTSFQFATALLDEDVGFQWLSPFSNESIHERLTQDNVRFLLTAPTPSQSPNVLAPAMHAARAAGYHEVERFTMPDGLRAILWWRSRGPSGAGWAKERSAVACTRPNLRTHLGACLEGLSRWRPLPVVGHADRLGVSVRIARGQDQTANAVCDSLGYSADTTGNDGHAAA